MGFKEVIDQLVCPIFIFVMQHLIPENLDLELLFKSFAPLTVKKRVEERGKQFYRLVALDSNQLKYWIPYCYYVIDLIVSASTKDKHHGYVNIHSSQSESLAQRTLIPHPHGVHAPELVRIIVYGIRCGISG